MCNEKLIIMHGLACLLFLLSSAVYANPPSYKTFQQEQSEKKWHIAGNTLSVARRNLEDLSGVFDVPEKDRAAVFTIDCSHNKLDKIDLQKLMDYFPHLQSVNASHNGFTKFTSDIVSHMPNFFYLNLAHNCLHEIEDGLVKDGYVRFVGSSINCSNNALSQENCQLLKSYIERYEKRALIVNKFAVAGFVLTALGVATLICFGQLHYRKAYFAYPITLIGAGAFLMLAKVIIHKVDGENYFMCADQRQHADV